jgi:hypothetical protein
LDVYYTEDFMVDCRKFCKLSYEGNNVPNYLHKYDIEDHLIESIVLQDVLDTHLIRALLLEDYTERKKE